jgi:hypothetical protein
VTIDTCDSEFDTLLAVYTGSSVSALTPAAASDDSCGPSGEQSRIEFNVAGGTTLRIAVDGFDGDAGYVVVALEFLEEPPPCPPPGVPPGPTYRGTHSQGGPVCFTVSADWSTVTSFLIARLRDSDGSFCPDHWFQPVTPSTPLAISNRSFSRRQLSGSFDAGQGATGTFGRAAPPPSCNPGLVSWSASTTAAPPWTLPLPVAAADKTAPAVGLRARSSQRAIKQKGIVIEVSCPTEACTATARGTVAVPGAARTYKLKSATKQIPRGGKAKLKLKFSKKALKAVKRALKRRKKIKARITVTVKDAAGNGATKKRSIRLKR